MLTMVTTKSLLDWFTFMFIAQPPRTSLRDDIKAKTLVN